MKRLLICIGLVFLLSLGATSAWAHDETVIVNSLILGGQVYFEHEDQDPWKGWINLEVTNTGPEAWGDFHFEIKETAFGGSVENVHFLDNPAPSITNTTLDYFVIDNDSIGATIDLYFYSDPILSGETVTFSVYTDNPDQVSFFGVEAYPTPVPVPAAAWLLGSGLLGVIGLRRKK
jgi:hypothetical protein